MWQPLKTPNRNVFRGERAALADPISTTFAYIAFGFKSSPSEKNDILRLRSLFLDDVRVLPLLNPKLLILLGEENVKPLHIWAAESTATRRKALCHDKKFAKQWNLIRSCSLLKITRRRNLWYVITILTIIFKFICGYEINSPLFGNAVMLRLATVPVGYRFIRKLPASSWTFCVPVDRKQWLTRTSSCISSGQR